jgi:hypothetical protein
VSSYVFSVRTKSGFQSSPTTEKIFKAIEPTLGQLSEDGRKGLANLVLIQTYIEATQNNKKEALMQNGWVSLDLRW